MPENLNDWLGLVVPEATVNWMANGSFERGVDGWTGTNAALTQEAGRSKYGGFGMRCTTTNVSNTVAPTNEQVITDAIGDWTFSGWLWTSSMYSVTVAIQNVGTSATITSVASNGDGWRSFELTALGVAAGVSLRPFFTGAPNSVVYVVDGLQFENKAYATTYCDGDQDECRWEGAKHNSPSRRPETARSGGRRRTFRQLGINVRSITGAGAVPVTNISEPYAVLPGAEYQRSTVNSRVITLNCQALGTNRDNLHDLRQLLISAVVSDVENVDPIWLWYNRGTLTMQIGVYYEGGLELSEVSKYTESFPIRLIAFDPYWQSTFDLSTSLVAQATRAIANGLAIRKNDQQSNTGTDWGWNMLGYKAGDSVSAIGAIEIAPNGDVYAAGTFSRIGGVTLSNIAYYDGYRWNAMGTGIAPGTVYCMAFAPDGSKVYVGGAFSSAGGVANNRFMIWDVASKTWQAPTNRNYASGNVYALLVHPTTGALYLGGSMSMSRAGGVTVAGLDWYNATYFDPADTTLTQWSVAGGGATVYSLCWYRNTWSTTNLPLVIAGDFTSISVTAGGGPPNNLTATNLAIWPIVGFVPQMSNLGAPVNNGIIYSAIASADNRYLYITGTFTTGAYSGGVMGYDGASWTLMPAGTSSTNAGARMSLSNILFSQGNLGRKLRIDKDGALWLLGLFAEVGNQQVAQGNVAGAGAINWLNNIARWNGTEWTLVDAMFYGGSPGTSADHMQSYSFAFNQNGEMIMGSSRIPTGLAHAGAIATAFDSDAPAPLQIVVLGSTGFLNRIINWSTKRELVFRNNIDLTLNRRIEIDTRPGSQKVTLNDTVSAYANLSGESALARFWLQKGKNRLAAFTPTHRVAALAAGSTVVFFFRERFSSIDAEPRLTL